MSDFSRNIFHPPAQVGEREEKEERKSPVTGAGGEMVHEERGERSLSLGNCLSSSRLASRWSPLLHLSAPSHQVDWSPFQSLFLFPSPFHEYALFTWHQQVPASAPLSIYSTTGDPKRHWPNGPTTCSLSTPRSRRSPCPNISCRVGQESPQEPQVQEP